MKTRRKSCCGADNGRYSHGMHGTPTYRSWAGMITRCTNPNRACFKNYGGRGISICERWKDFKSFLADMGERPAGKTLDRKDNDGHYCKENCRWATAKEQRANQRDSIKTVCKHGHALTPDNIYVYSDGHRACRICRRRMALDWKRNKESRNAAA